MMVVLKGILERCMPPYKLVVQCFATIILMKAIGHALVAKKHLVNHFLSYSNLLSKRKVKRKFVRRNGLEMEVDGGHSISTRLRLFPIPVKLLELDIVPRKLLQFIWNTQPNVLFMVKSKYKIQM
jgi:hypothetical protein